MNFLNTFEDHVAGIFGAARAPFSFKKLARQAAHEMEGQTLVVGGVDTAPALYTILIANDDDPLMAPYYPQLTREVGEFVKASAEKRGYAFVGEPLVRFMIDPSLKMGVVSAPQPRQQPRPAPAPAQQPAAQPNPFAPQDIFGASDLFEPAAPVPVPKTVGREAIATGMAAGAAAGVAAGAAAAAVPAAAPRPQQAAPIAQLRDVVTGEVLPIAAARCTIGRERAAADVVLRDPNVSRRHAELTFTGSDWTIEDLNSTNGTLVNSRRITRCPLRSGDLLTFGLSTFEFRG